MGWTERQTLRSVRAADDDHDKDMPRPLPSTGRMRTRRGHASFDPRLFELAFVPSGCSPPAAMRALATCHESVQRKKQPHQDYGAADAAQTHIVGEHVSLRKPCFRCDDGRSLRGDVTRGQLLRLLEGKPVPQGLVCRQRARLSLGLLQDQVRYLSEEENWAKHFLGPTEAPEN